MKLILRSSLFLMLFFGGVGVGFGRRVLPCPIIFIHGLNGSYTSWNEFASYLNNYAALNVPINGSSLNNLNFSLNHDGNNNTSNASSDYRDLTYEPSLGNCDGYIVDFNFGTKGNQAAIFKQGLAIRDAIRHVRNVTGADKVILVGHSMGGLAARDYLQNSSKWQSDGQHHVAKLVTVGTPHGGSNGSGFGIFTDELCEAVRDLRYSYSSGYSGAYLFGGIENSSRITGRLTNFDNIDVNCNGSLGNSITGINQYSSIPSDLSYSCIVGTGKPTYQGQYLISSSVDGDQIVESSRANLNTYYSANASIFNVSSSAIYYLYDSFHSNLQKNFPIENMNALDETSQGYLAPEIYLATQYRGYFNNQSNNTSLDIDANKVYLRKGITRVSINAATGSEPNVYLIDPSGTTYSSPLGNSSTTLNTLTTTNPFTGYHQINFRGYSSGTWNAYNYNVYNAPSSSLYANATSTCNQSSVTLTATESGFDSYQWYKDGLYIATTATNYINASTTANGTSTYTVKTTKWGVTIDGLNSWQFKDYSIPTPTLTASLGGILTTSSLNICNGTGVVLSTNCGANTNPLWQNYATSVTLYVNATTTTNYTVQCSNYFCTSSNSPPVRIVNEPNIQSTKSGNWQDPTMWTNNFVPLNCQTVTIQTGHTVTVPINDAKAKNIIIRGNLNFQNVSPTVKGKVGLGI